MCACCVCLWFVYVDVRLLCIFVVYLCRCAPLCMLVVYLCTCALWCLHSLSGPWISAIVPYSVAERNTSTVPRLASFLGVCLSGPFTSGVVVMLAIGLVFQSGYFISGVLVTCIDWSLHKRAHTRLCCIYGGQIFVSNYTTVLRFDVPFVLHLWYGTDFL